MEPATARGIVMLRAIFAIAFIALSAVGAMMIIHNSIAHHHLDAVGIGIGVGSCAAALIAFVEFVRCK